MFIPIKKQTLIIKKVEREVFLMNLIYPNKKNVFIVPNRENKREYYVNRVNLNQQTNVNFKNGGARSFSYETKPSISLIRRICLWCPIMKRKEIIT